MAVAGNILLPYQRDWINDPSPLKLMDKSRRTGITWAEAYDAVSMRFRRTQPRNLDYWMSSADEGAAVEFIEYCRFFAGDLFGKIADHYTDAIEDPETKRAATAHCIRCPNGSRIVGLTSNPRRFRSKGGDVTLDEFAFHDQPREMLKAAGPVTTWGGSLRIISTHNGENSAFNRHVLRCAKLLAKLGHDPKLPPRLAWAALAAASAEHAISPIYSYHRVTIEDAIAQGLLDKINAKRESVGLDPQAAEDFLHECRMKCADEDAFLEEYMCQPSSDASAWLTYAVIEACESDDCAEIDDGLVGYSGGPCTIGVDVGVEHDLTVIWVLEKVGDVQWSRQVTRLKKVNLPEQEKILAAVIRSVKCHRVCIDKSGLGLGLFQYSARQFGSIVEGVQFTAPAKHELAIAIKQAFESREVRIPADDASLRDSLHAVRKVVTAAGNERFDAARSEAGHADEFWALALALHAGVTAPFVQFEGQLASGSRAFGGGGMFSGGDIW